MSTNACSILATQPRLQEILVARVFLSSVVTGFEEYREAAADAIATLGHEVVRSEQFGVRPDTPQRACLGELRSTELVVLVLGARYGFVNPVSGLSATHEEFREAAATKPVLVFIQGGVTPEEEQLALIREAQDWARGGLTGSFATPEELRRAVTQAVHRWEIAQSAGPADETEMLERGRRLLPDSRSGGAKLAVVAIPGPRQELVSPVRLDGPQLREQLLDLAQTSSLFDRFERTVVRHELGCLVMEQPAVSLRLDSSGAFCVVQLAAFPESTDRMRMETLVEEDLRDRIGRTLRTLATGLDSFDSTHRCPSIVVFAALIDGAWLPWKTLAEHRATPDSATMGRGGDLVEVLPSGQPMPRPALRNRANEIAEELTARFRQAVIQA